MSLNVGKEVAALQRMAPRSNPTGVDGYEPERPVRSPCAALDR